MTEKQKLMYIMTKDRGKRNIQQDSMSTLFPDFIIDIPSPSIPQLQLPSWYSPPKKIACLEQWSRNTARSADAGTHTSVQSQNIVDIMTTGEEDMLNPMFGFQIRGQNHQEVITSSLPKSTVATQDSSADKPTQKNKVSPQAAVDSTATEDNSNETHSSCMSPRPGSNQIPAVAMIQMQQKLSSEGHMDHTSAVTSVEEQTGQQSSMQADDSAAETIPVSSTHQTAAKTAWPTTTTTKVTDIRADGMDTLEPTRHNEHYQEAPVGNVNQPVSDHTVLTSQSANQKQEMKSVPHPLQTCSKYFGSSNFGSGNKCCPANESMECCGKTVQNDLPPSQVQPATNEDGDIDMSADDVQYLSPVTDESMSVIDQSSEVGQCQEGYHFSTSPEGRCSPLSPQGDYLMTSPDGTLALKSPPFVISPTIPTTNNDLFGAPSNQQSKTGFTFNFGALNIGRGNVNDVAEKGKPNDGFQFNFNKKTSSGSFFKLF
jgi:hypothetical protein